MGYWLWVGVISIKAMMLDGPILDEVSTVWNRYWIDLIWNRVDMGWGCYGIV